MKWARWVRVEWKWEGCVCSVRVRWCGCADELSTPVVVHAGLYHRCHRYRPMDRECDELSFFGYHLHSAELTILINTSFAIRFIQNAINVVLTYLNKVAFAMMVTNALPTIYHEGVKMVSQ